MADLHFCARQRGSAGLAALFAMALLLIIGGTMLGVSTNEVKIAAGYRDGIAAQHAAEAGAKRALAVFDQSVQLNQSWNWLHTDVYLNNGKHNVRYNVKIKLNGSETVPAVPPASGVYTVTALGTANGAVRTVVVTVTVSGSGEISVLSWSAYASK
jgi:Tfp pilus assembly protein PilX